MKLEIWVDGSMEIVYVFFLFTYFEKDWLAWQQIGLKHGIYNNICDKSKKPNIFMNFKRWIDGSI
jgi:hypothetical protein